MEGCSMRKGRQEPPPAHSLAMLPAAAPALSAVAEADLRRGEETHPFLQYYGLLSHQQNMLQDTVRTGTYQKAILSNPADFKGKVVLDVGAGTGILSIFAAHAGARKVYAVEASAMADMAVLLIEANGLSDIITVVRGKIEDVELPELVDIIVSEPMGFLLVHERMLESYLVGRDRFLKPQTSPRSRMFPSLGKIRVMPFTDALLHSEQAAKTLFWRTNDFFGVDMTVLEAYATQQSFAQPVIGCFDPAQFIAADDQISTHLIDFDTASISDLTVIEVPFRFRISRNSLMHGVCCWFDVDFMGSQQVVTLSTGPRSPTTHWYQIRLLLATPLGVNTGQVVSGRLLMHANQKFSYDVLLEAKIEGTAENITSANQVSLQDPYYHYLNSSVSGATGNGGGNPYASWARRPDNGDFASVSSSSSQSED